MRNTRYLSLAIGTFFLFQSALVVAQQPIHWEATLDNAQRLAGQTNRLVLIQFWAPWCNVCRRMEAEVFSQPTVAADIAVNYVPVKINADNFPATAQRYNINALPTTVIITPQGQLLDSMRGRIEPAEFSVRLNRIAANAKQQGATPYAQIPANTAPATPAIAGPVQAQPAAPATPTPIAQPSYVPAGQPIAASQPSAAVSQPPVPPSQPLPAGRQPYAPQQQIAAQNPTNPVLPAPAQPAAGPALGLDGYCSVSLVEKQQWVIGDRRWGAIHRGRTYLFVGPEEQRRFLADPDRYAPAVSGNDVVLAAEQGRPVPGMREHGVFFNNRVFLFSSEDTLEKFSRNPAQYATQGLGAMRTAPGMGTILQ
jgi:protein disulfide-isomerase